MFLPRCVLILAAFLVMNVLLAQSSSYRFSQLDVSAGLSHNQVNCIYKDQTGFMWFGTMSGLNRYDGYTFKIFKHNLNDSLSLNDDYIIKIFEGPQNKMVVQTRSGLNIYDPVTAKFISTNAYLNLWNLPQNITNIVKAGENYFFVSTGTSLYKLDKNNRLSEIKHVMLNPSSIDAAGITDIKKDSKNNLVLIHENGVLEKLDGDANKVIYRTIVEPSLNKEALVYSLFVDKDDDVWLFVPPKNFGVIYCDTKLNKAKRINKESGFLNNDIITTIIQDDKGLMWIGTDHGGINILNKHQSNVSYITNKEDDIKTVAENSIYTLFEDDNGIIWVGTFKKGISFYTDNIARFPLYRHKPSDKNSLPYEDVNRFLEDAKGNIWIGTNGGGLIYFDRKENKFTSYRHDPANSNSISNDIIVSLYIDHEGKLWIGSYYGGLDCFDGNRFIHYKHNNRDAQSLADDRVWEIFEDADNTLWIGTLGGGLDLFNRKKNVFYHHTTASAANPLQSDYISAFETDKNGNLWIGTAYGIDVMDIKTRQIIHYNTGENNLSNYNVNAVFRDRDNNMWIGTREGLNVFDASTKKFQSFRTENGLPDNTVWTIVQDKQGYLWVSTSKGLSKIKAVKSSSGFTISCNNYDESDGLQSRVFNDNAGYRTSKGELIFGGASGFNLFDPSAIGVDKQLPKLVFTDLQIFNKTIEAGDKINNHQILAQSLSSAKELKLRYNENVFSIEFAALNYENTSKIKYAYKLEGFNDQWLTTDSKNRKATYTNLDPGEYIFHVKACNADGVWNEEGIALKIVVLPPFWRTNIAYIIYALIIIAVLFFARRRTIQRAHARFALAQERKEAQRLHELDIMKIKFFTNVSHEFRTPLSLILTPLDKMIKRAKSEDEKKQFELIHRNGRRLLNLVNQLMDFRKMEVQELHLYVSKGDVVKFIKEVSYSFNDIAENKNIHFNYQSDCENLYTSFDHDKLERILFNLLSNAFKFTPEHGNISVEVSVEKNNSDASVEIRVRDTGIGIKQDKLDKIFDRFFQSEIPGTLLNKGSGIGLAITKEFVKMHNGSIKVESETEKGSCFTIALPFKIEDASETQKPLDIETEEASEREVEQPLLLSGVESLKHAKDSKKQTILLVEDNEDFRFYLKDNLREFYNILEAENGKTGWQKTLSEHPDLIVSDISMPVMDGIDLCKKIKKDVRTKQIPVILLTALTGEEQLLKGLETGASDYMTKPFNFEVMLSRIKNILSQQQSLKKTFAKQVDAKASDIPTDSPNEKFIQQALQIVEKNISNPGFSVEELSRELCMSRVAVYKRIFALTEKAPIEFIRSVRLERAAQLLGITQMTIAEVAYEVGFNNPKYFTKYFKAAYGILPSVYIAEKRKERTPAEK